MTVLKVKLNCTLKRYDGDLFTDGTIFTGTLSELPEEIRRAVKAKKGYISVTELVEEKIAEVVTETIPELKGGIDTPAAKIEETEAKPLNETENEGGDKAEVKETKVSKDAPITKKTLKRGKAK